MLTDQPAYEAMSGKKRFICVAGCKGPHSERKNAALLRSYLDLSQLQFLTVISHTPPQIKIYSCLQAAACKPWVNY